MKIFCFILMAFMISGCRSGTKVDGPSTQYHDKIWNENPGIRREFEIEITPPVTAPIPDPAIEPDEMAYSLVSWRPDNQPSDDQWDKTIQEAIENGWRIRYKYTEDILPSVSNRDTQVEARGPSMETSNTSGTFGFQTFMQSIPFPWGRSSGEGSSLFNAEILGRSINWLYLFGGLVLIGAILPLMKKPRDFTLGGIIAGCGLGLVAVGTVYEKYPWLLAVLFILLVMAAGWIIYRAWLSKKNLWVLSKVSKGIESLPSEPKAEAKDAIADAAGDDIVQVRSVVRKAKARK